MTRPRGDLQAERRRFTGTETGSDQLAVFLRHHRVTHLSHAGVVRLDQNVVRVANELRRRARLVLRRRTQLVRVVRVCEHVARGLLDLSVLVLEVPPVRRPVAAGILDRLLVARTVERASRYARQILRRLRAVRIIVPGVGRQRRCVVLRQARRS